MDESLLGTEVLAIIAMYDAEGALLGTYQNKQYTDTIKMAESTYLVPDCLALAGRKRFCGKETGH